MLLISQEFVREKKIFRVNPSIRDYVRASILYKFFHGQKNDKPFLSSQYNDKPLTKFWQSLLMAVAVAYYFRLPSKYIADYEEIVDKFLKLRKSPIFKFTTLVEHELAHVFSKLTIPVGIAKTKSLQINLFCNIVAMETVLPLLITGEPGSSKTLSFNIACDNMKGPRSKEEMFQGLKNINRFHYQCSESSTSSEIQSVYRSAIENQKRFEQARMTNEQCVVFLDEGGLPNERKQALKVFHHYADHPIVCTVILSNVTLDAAKTNRCIHVLLPDIDKDDLEVLASGLLFRDAAKIDSFSKAVAKGSCEAYSTCNQFTDTRTNLFGLRDFVYYFKDIRRALDENPGFQINADTILHSLQRNFNGISQGNFESLARHFISKINEQLPSGYKHLSLEKLEKRIDRIKIIRESIEQSLVDKQDDPNHTSQRYVMLIDPTKVSSSTNALNILNIPGKDKKLKKITVSDFSEDDSEIVKSRQISEIKTCMELGETVSLTNSGPIQTNFYELFNRYFISVMGNDDKKQYYANVAVGSYSRPCPVDPQFQIIVHISLEDFKNAPAPFLNRFEKYILCLKDAYEFHPERKKVKILEDIQQGVEDFITRCQPSTFYGLIDEETLYSLLLAIIEGSRAQGSKIPIVPSPMNIAWDEVERNEEADAFLAIIGQTLENQGEKKIHVDVGERLREFIRKANFFLIQIARPESIFLLRNFLPKAYLVEYLTNQEHFSVINFFHNLQKTFLLTNSPNVQSGRKWIIYTRTTGEVNGVSNDDKIKTLLLNPYIEEMKEQGKECNINQILQVISLSNIGSSSNCEEIVKKFYSNNELKILFCIIDMGIVSKLQVNFLRNIIDEAEHQMNQEQLSRKLIVFLLHFPPSKLQFSACYTTTFTNGWNFIYIDSFGAQYLFGLADDHQEATLVRAPDMKRWIRAAFSLDQHLSLKDFQTEFEVI